MAMLVYQRVQEVLRPPIPVIPRQFLKKKKQVS